MFRVLGRRSAGCAVEKLCGLAAGIFHGGFGSQVVGMTAGRIAEMLEDERQQSLGYAWVHGCGGLVIQIDHGPPPGIHSIHYICESLQIRKQDINWPSGLSKGGNCRLTSVKDAQDSAAYAYKIQNFNCRY